MEGNSKKIVTIVIALLLIAIILPIGLTQFYNNPICKNSRIEFGSTDDIVTYVNGSILTDESGFEYNSSDYTNTTIRVAFTIPTSVENDTDRTFYIRFYSLLPENVDEYYTIGDENVTINMWVATSIDEEEYPIIIVFFLTTTNTTDLEFQLYWREDLCETGDIAPITSLWGILPILLVIGLAISFIKKIED